MSIREELVALKSNGMLRAEDVVAWARDHEASALYSALEWDNEKAADQYRLWQVRRLIAIHVTDDQGERRLVSLSIDRIRGGGYRDVEDIAVNAELSSTMLADALDELRRIRTKYNKVKALVNVWNAVEDADRRHGIVRHARQETRAA